MTNKDDKGNKTPANVPTNTSVPVPRRDPPVAGPQGKIPALPTKVSETAPVPTIRLRPPIALPGDKPSGRGRPYVLRGREEELSDLAAALHNPDRTNFVLDGPPGCGKTTLAAGLSAYAHQQGFTVLRLQASAIKHPVQFIHALWCCFDPDGPVQNKSQTDHTGGGVDIKVFSVNKALEATKQYTSSDSVVANITACYHQHRDRSNGILIIMDNAASWRHKTEDESIKNICEALLDGVRDIGVDILTVYAGTPGTVQTITELTSDRLELSSHYQLQGIRTSAIAQIIADHLNVQDPDTGRWLPKQTVTPNQMAMLAEACQGNVLHATSIGYHLQQHLRTSSQANQHEDNAIIGIAEKAQGQVYSQMYANINRDNKIAFTTLAHAIHNNNDVLYPDDAETLLGALTAHLKNPMTLEDYVQKGLLELICTEYSYARYPESNRTEDYYRIPIPNFADWLYKKNFRKRKQIDATIREHLSAPASIQPWVRAEHDHIYPVSPKVRRSVPENLATGNPYIGLPLTPGDGADAPQSWHEYYRNIEAFQQQSL